MRKESSKNMLELRKMNYEDIKEQWECVTALPADENGLTNPYEGVSFNEYRDSVLPELMMHENPINMPDWFVYIGYSIKKEFRGKGYRTKGLTLVLDLARQIVPEEEIYLRVLKSNIPSFKAISNNGAYIADEDTTHYLMRVKK